MTLASQITYDLSALPGLVFEPEMSRMPKTNEWYVVQSNPGAEYVAETEMRRVGLNVYLPQYRREFRHHRTKVRLTRQFPLFAGYLFAAAEDFRWPALLTCNGVARDAVLKDLDTDRPIPIPEAVVERIRESEAMGLFDELRGVDTRLHVGSAVKVADGVLSAMQGPISRVKNRRSVEMLTRMFGAEIKATVSVEQLERAA